jgi:hypothetical protein
MLAWNNGWSQILPFYFYLDDKYGLEREAHTGEGSLARTNMLLENIRHRNIEKAVFVECKRLTTKANDKRDKICSKKRLLSSGSP